MPMTKPKKTVGTNHPDYGVAMPKWTRCRDACSGSDAVKAAGPLYLKPLSTHSDSDSARVGGEDYEAYKFRALWYGASRRTLMGLTGSVTMRKPQLDASSEKTRWALAAAAELADELVAEQVGIGRAALVVDQRENERPATTLWWAESVVNWRFRSEEGKHVLELLVLEDDELDLEDDGGDATFSHETRRVRHAYRLKGGLCEYGKWRKKDRKDKGAAPAPAMSDSTAAWDESWEEVVAWRPVAPRGLAQLDHIPATIVGVDSVNSPVVSEPLLLDVVDINFSHYSNSADLEHGRHWCAMPTALAAGFPRHDENGVPMEFVVGGQSAWISDNPAAHASYLEFSGAGLGHIAEGMRDKQQMMAVAGARLLEEPKASVESAETLKTRLAGEQSVIARVANTASRALSWVAQEMVLFEIPGYEREEEKDVVKLDPMTPQIGGQELAALVGAMQAGAISWRTLFEKLQAGRVIPESRTMEEEAALIAAGPPAPAPVADGDPNVKDGEDDPTGEDAKDDPDAEKDPATEEEPVSEEAATG